MNTAAPIQAPSDQSIKPEWLRVRGAIQFSGIKRSKLYELMEEGRVKFITLRERGKQRGIRLISYDSLSGFLNGLLAEQEQARAAETKSN